MRAIRPYLTTVKSSFCAFVLLLALNVYMATSALAYSCEAEFAKAIEMVTEAETLITEDTDARILAMLKEARGIAEAGITSHRHATERHTGDVGKFMHSDSVRKGLWAQSLAKQALFLLTGKV